MSIFGMGGAIRKKKLSEGKRDFLDVVNEYRHHRSMISELQAEEEVIKLQITNPVQFQKLLREARQRY